VSGNTRRIFVSAVDRARLSVEPPARGDEAEDDDDRLVFGSISGGSR
jgi:hypothetical protein